MKIALVIVAAAAALLEANAYSVNQKPLTMNLLDGKSSQMSSLEACLSMTRREPIRMPTNTPMVPYKPPGSQYAQFIDLYSAMYRDRTMLIGQFIDEEAANNIISIILYLRKEDPKEPIHLYFNVPGALLRPGLAVYDLIMQTREQCEVHTVNLGLCTGMGALLCAAGTKGNRSSMPNARFLLHRTGMDQPFQGQATDIGLEVKNVKRWNDRMEMELAKLTGQDLEDIQKDLSRDFYLSSEEAVRYGLIDQVLLPTYAKRAAKAKEADLGAFEGDDDSKYQGKDNKGGWGSRETPKKAPPKKKDDDDDGPEILKG